MKAAFNGLIYDAANGVTPSTSGAFALNTTAKGAFSGSLQWGGTRYSVHGGLGTSGFFQSSISRRRLNPITVQLQIEGANTIGGSISDGTATAQLTGDRAMFDGRNSLAPQQGQYTLIIPGSDDVQHAPGGDSFGAVTVDKSGRVRLSLALADGTKASQSAMVSTNGQWPLYISLYSAQGLVLSWINFANAPGSDLGGDLSWIKPSSAKSKYYSDGFANESTLVSGSSYTRPGRGSTVLSLPNGMIAFNDLPQTITNKFALGANNRVTNLSSNKMTLSFSPSTGLFNGRVTTPTNSQAITFTGAVLQKYNLGAGYFLGHGQSGEVLLFPSP
jgi:hypothetical protein